MKRQRSTIDIFAVIAISWLIIAIILTIFSFGKLGARGWLWLGIHNIFCIIGVSHEWFRHQKRVQLAKNATSSQPSQPNPQGANEGIGG